MNDHAKASVSLFKPNGKWYTDEQWTVPEGAIGPFDMDRSPDFRRIDGGPVLVTDDSPWGYPILLLGTTNQDRRPASTRQRAAANLAVKASKISGRPVPDEVRALADEGAQ